MLDVLAILMVKDNKLRGGAVTYYIDIDNALHSRIKESGDPVEIQPMAAFIWNRIRDIRIAPWLGRVPSKRNIADLPKRQEAIKYASFRWEIPHNVRKLNKMVEQAIQMIMRLGRT